MSAQPAQPRVPSCAVAAAVVSVAISLAAIVWPMAVRAGPPYGPPRGQAPPATSPAGPYEYVGSVDGTVDQDHNPFSCDGTAVLTYQSHRNDRFARLWDTRTLKPLTNPLPHQALRWCRLSDDGKTVVTAGGFEIWVWDVATSKLRSDVDTRFGMDLLDISPDGTRFVTIGPGSETAKVWRVGEKRPVLWLEHASSTVSAQFDPTGRRIATHENGRSPSEFHVWDADTGRELYPPITFDDNSLNWGSYRAQFDRTG